MSADINFYIQSIIAVLIITDPITRGVYGNRLRRPSPSANRGDEATAQSAVRLGWQNTDAGVWPGG